MHLRYKNQSSCRLRCQLHTKSDAKPNRSHTNQGKNESPCILRKPALPPGHGSALQAQCCQPLHTEALIRSAYRRGPRLARPKTWSECRAPSRALRNPVQRLAALRCWPGGPRPLAQSPAAPGTSPCHLHQRLGVYATPAQLRRCGSGPEHATRHQGYLPHTEMKGMENIQIE